MKFDLKTDWSKWEVVEEEGAFTFERLEFPEMGCVACDGYAEWEVKGSHDPRAARVVECSNCLLADATDPTIPGAYFYHP